MNAHVATPSSIRTAAVATAAGLAASLLAPRRDDRELLRLCRRAMAALEREQEIENRYMAALEAFEIAKPERPKAPGPCEAWRAHEGSSEAMRAAQYATSPQTAEGRLYRQRLAVVVAHEKACAALDRETGLSRTEAPKRAVAAVRAAVAPLVDIEAATTAGMAAKAGVLLKAADRRFEFDGEPFGGLALSMARDAQRLGANGPQRRRRSC